MQNIMDIDTQRIFDFFNSWSLVHRILFVVVCLIFMGLTAFIGGIRSPENAENSADEPAE